MVTVYIPPLLRSLVGHREVVWAAGTNVRQVIADLERQFPSLHEKLRSGDQLRPGLAVAVNGAVSRLGLLEKTPDGAEVHFLPALGGG